MDSNPEFLEERLFNIKSEEDFTDIALKIFEYQYNNVPFYNTFCNALKKSPKNVNELHTIPFLPIEFFKSERILSGNKFDKIFLSSGTSDAESRSKHYVADLKLYEKSLYISFKQFIGDPVNFHFFSLLPSYAENSHSSLLYMLDLLNSKSKFKTAFKHDPSRNELLHNLEKINENGGNAILCGVSFALLDLAETCELELPNVIIMETGGMKGKRKEITRSELHEKIHAGLKPKSIVSEYGMTELLSQAYAVNSELFTCPSWMKVLVRDIHDPLSISKAGTGGLSVIDLCNLNSCSFIATSDVGKVQKDGKFEVLGRYDHSDVRGCNLLYDLN